ncbi:dUTP diphosphatase [Clostridium perfringens]|jgi:dUTP pyrophosphatase|uniref:dUTP diphosphatase n=1 Tax=Clostridium perfringens TaxID=1502 RepID=A0AAW4J6A4_CLOPF|nr:deoxyuridine 5'-triphosphate nucleotidohydrolase [Clostridium perfringens]MBO3356230.1 deoxyuridine 5'-triphosphate nucleotidohydrolase [Clostridium perfringens]MBO3359429.1 deoxyuridine 5'-triphosphate nucleotidohydrolase [Clostridium perfringens]
MKNLTLKIKMMDKNLTKIGGDILGEWYDLRCSDLISLNGQDIGISKMFERTKIKYKKGDILQLGLGIATELPEGYEAVINPRSSTFKNYGFLLTNSQGVIDCTYRGQWMAMVYCTRDGEISYNDRFLQFRIQKQQPLINIEFVDELSQTKRGEGGYGSTGVK